MRQLLTANGMLVKRPVLVGVDFVLFGFRQELWEEILKEKTPDDCCHPADPYVSIKKSTAARSVRMALQS